MIFPDPFVTIKQSIKILSKSYVYKCLGSSLLRMLIGFTISFLLAMISGVIAGCNQNIKKFFKPTIIALKSIPTATLLFLFLVLVGAKYAPIFIVILISYPILYESFVGGIENIDENIINALKLDGENSLKNIVKVKIPLAIPYVLVGIASSFALSFKIEIMAEILTGDTKEGLGAAILAAQKNDPTNMIPIFAYSLIAIIFILIIDLIANFVKKRANKAVSK